MRLEPGERQNGQIRERNRAADSPRLLPFEEERREVLESVFGAIGNEPPDADRTAAWFHLLHHLNRVRTRG